MAITRRSECHTLDKHRVQLEDIFRSSRDFGLDAGVGAQKRIHSLCQDHEAVATEKAYCEVRCDCEAKLSWPASKLLD
jgi:hypothetical protein